MDKKSIIGIVAIGLIFIGFVIYSSKQQAQYQRDLAAYREYLASQQPAEQATAADRLAAEIADSLSDASRDSLRQARAVARLGESLAEAQAAEAETFTVENDVLALTFSTRGGQIVDAILKEYTKYPADGGEHTEPVKLFDPASAKFDLAFYVKNGLNNLKVNTSDYTFRALPVTRDGEAQRVVMQLPVAEDARIEYEYLIYDTDAPERDYLVDFRVRLVGMAPQMANQTSLVIDWSNTSYQNEKGFQNENMYTTLAYRLPDENSIEDLGMSTADKSERVATAVNWVAFKQQFFSSILIAEADFANANMAYTTAQPGSGYIKHYTAQMTVPYTAGDEAYDFAFYLGPNKYAILNKVTASNGDGLYLERLIPLGWGIIGWINRWFVIPLFDLLRQFIGSFGLIILILAILVKVIISPLTYKSYVSTAKMRVIKPEIDALAQKYPRQEDAMKRQQATMELYKKAGINPMGGCIPMLIQLPIVIAMFRFFPASIELRDQPFLWADDLSSYDSVLNLPFSIPFYGDHVSLFALLMAGALFAFSYINYQQTSSSQPQMAGMKFMMVYMMPIMMLFWFNNYSSGLCYYYFLGNLITIAQTMIIRRMIDDEKIRAIMQANAARRSNGKKSKFQARYEELMRQQEAAQRQAQRGRKK